jgi:acyl-ACP thioesterase
MASPPARRERSVSDDVAGVRETVEPDACSAPFRVRFDEAGPDGLLRTSVLLRYAQDLAWYHSARRGFDRDWYRERGLTWLARAAEVALDASIRVGDELIGTTRVVGWRRVWARRRTEFVDASGAPVAWTHVDWLLLDARGAPTRVPVEFQPVFGAPDAPFALARVPLREPPPDAMRSGFAVRPQELDPMDHVNNAVYADWLDEQVIAAGGLAEVRAIPRLARLEYARAAEAGSSVETFTWREADTGWSCRIADSAGTELLRARLESAVISP